MKRIPCSSDLEDVRSSLKEGSSLESEDETVTQPSEVAGSFLTTICTPELGGLNCVVRDENGKLIDFSDNGLSYKPDYDLYLTKDLAKDTPESIEASIASGNPDNLFKHTGSSLPKPGSQSTIAISFMGQNYLTKSMGEFKLSKEEKRDDNVGKIFTYSLSDYNPEAGRKHVKLNRCVQAVLMESWYNGGDSDFIEIDFTFNDLAAIPYELVGSDPTVIAHSTNNTERWRYSVEWGIAIGIDDFDLGVHANFAAALDPATSCRSKYEAFKAGNSSDLFKEVEAEVSILVADFMKYKEIVP